MKSEAHQYFKQIPFLFILHRHLSAESELNY